MHTSYGHITKNIHDVKRLPITDVNKALTTILVMVSFSMLAVFISSILSYFVTEMLATALCWIVCHHDYQIENNLIMMVTPKALFGENQQLEVPQQSTTKLELYLCLLKNFPNLQIILCICIGQHLTVATK